MRTYTLGSLFSGVGGLELGLESTGRFETVWQSEIDPFCRAVLRKNWNKCKIYEDVKDVRIENEVKQVDVICGGFPCQDLSIAREGSGQGRGKGLDGSKSGLYREFIRVIEELSPIGFVIENVPTLVNRGLETILGEIAKLGYDAEWHIVSAASVGGPHLRKRVFIMGYANCSHPQRGWIPSGVQEENEDTYCSSGWRPDKTWPTEPDFPRVVNGVPNWSHRAKALGNAVVPKVAGVVGKRFVEIIDRIPAKPIDRHGS